MINYFEIISSRDCDSMLQMNGHHLIVTSVCFMVTLGNTKVGSIFWVV